MNRHVRDARDLSGLDDAERFIDIVDGDAGHEVGAGVAQVDIFRGEIEATAAQVRAAYDAGVRLLCGSESGFSLTPYGHWHARELELFVAELGLSPVEAIRCGTANGATALRMDDGEIGVVADDDAWVGILSLASDDALIVDRGAGIDLSTLGELTRQDDVVFAAIQVLTMTVPGPTEAMLAPGSLATGSYLELTGAEEPTPPAVRRTWLALRLDPRLCMEAVDRRGSGQAGVMATLRFGLHRAQAQLKRQGVAAHPLDAAGVADVLALTTSAWTGQDDEVSSESWEQWRSGSLVHETRGIRSFGKEPGQNYQKLLDSLSQAPSMMVLTSFTVSPGEPPRGAVRQIMPTQELADAADEELIGEAGDIVSFGPLGGVQIPGLLATIPLGRRVG